MTRRKWLISVKACRRCGYKVVERVNRVFCPRCRNPLKVIVKLKKRSKR